MFEIISDRIIKIAVDYGVISSQECDLYQYAYSMMLAYILSWASLVIVGILLNCFWGMAVFLLTFSPVRIYAGGFHARSYGLCYWLSLSSILIMVFFLKFFTAPWCQAFSVISGLVASIIIFCKSPIANPNKPLDEQESKKYQEKARLIVSVELLIVVSIARVPMLNQMLFFMSAALIMEAILLLIPCSKALDNM